MNAVIYARYSSERQTEQSIEGQLRECQEYAEKNNIKIVEHYIDRAISGKTDNRPAFQQMIKDSSSKEFSQVLVYKLDRFARNRYDSAMYKSKLKKNGVKVISVKENITDSPEGIILEGLLESMNEYYSAELSQKIKRGMRENVLKGKTTGGNIALGFYIDENKKLAVEPKQANVVKSIFEMYSSGSNYAEIINTLNKKGCKTSRGNAFNKSSIQRILKNRRYIGEIEYNGEVVNECPSIIEVEVFNKVQARLAEFESHRKKHQNKAEYILTSKLICGKCHAKMSGISGTSQTKKIYNYYQCKNDKAYKLPKFETEQLVVKSIMQYLSDTKIDYISKRAHEIYVARRDKSSEIVQLQKDAKTVQKSIDNLMTAIEQGIITKSTKTRLIELEQQLEDINLEITKAKIKAPDLTQEHFKFLLTRYTNIDVYNTNFCKRMLDTLVHQIIVFDDKIAVVFNLTDSNSEYDNLEYIESIVKSSSKVAFGGGDANLSEPQQLLKAWYFGLFLRLQISELLYRIHHNYK